MPTLTDSDLLDLAESTQKDYGPPRLTQIAQDLQDYEVMSKWLKKDKVTLESGNGIHRTLMDKLGDTAAHVGLGEVDNVDIAPLLDGIDVPWRQARTHWGFERREALKNRGKAVIVKVIQPRRVAALINMAKILEVRAWAAPSTTDVLMPYGIPYYVVPNATTGFTGTVPGSHTTVAGKNPTDDAVWRNYAGTYSAPTRPDLVKKLRTAHRKTHWKSPVTIQEFRGRKGNQRRIYTDEDTVSAFEDIAEGQNDNLGNDVAPKDASSGRGGVRYVDGQVTFRRHPIIYISYLDDHVPADITALSGTNPLYMIDHETFFPVVLAGDFLRESKPAIKADQHNVVISFVDISYNYICIDRRRNTCFYRS